VLGRWEAYGVPVEPELELAPDHYFKQGFSGGPFSFMELQNPNMDALCADDSHQEHFVQYLRICMRWGGFPGFATFGSYPEQDIAYLANDLREF
jgi:hypothetical protein